MRASAPAVGDHLDDLLDRDPRSPHDWLAAQPVGVDLDPVLPGHRHFLC
jgi:hypothetical protein